MYIIAKVNVWIKDKLIYWFHVLLYLACITIYDKHNNKQHENHDLILLQLHQHCFNVAKPINKNIMVKNINFANIVVHRLKYVCNARISSIFSMDGVYRFKNLHFVVFHSHLTVKSFIMKLYKITIDEILLWGGIWWTRSTPRF